MSHYVLEKPYVYNNDWLVFPNATFSDLDATDCNDTISGVCYKDKNLDECIKLCAESKDGECGAGYFITGKNSKICVPIRTSLHPLLNPAFRLRNKNLYPVLDNMTVNTFINTKQFPFPPKLPNAVFFEDSFSLQNVKTKMEIDLPPGTHLQTSQVHMDKDDEGLHIQLLPFRTSIERIQYYIPMRYNTPVIFNIPGTSILIVKGQTMQLEWAPRIINTPQVENTFKIHSVNYPDQDIAFYTDIVYITYQDSNIVVLNESTNNLELMYGNYDTAIKNGMNVQFRFIPKIQSYYCDGRTCKPIKLEHADIDKDNATYKGYPVTRNPKCWGMCNYITPTGLDLSRNKKSTNIILFIFIAIFLLIGIGVLIWRLRRSKS